MNKLKGKPIADKILADLKEKITSKGKSPGLAVILVGENKASQIYVELKKKRAEEIGVRFSLYYFEDNVSEYNILEIIGKLNGDSGINGIIVQLPLPGGFDRDKIIGSILPEKDVDGFHSRNMEMFSAGRERFWPVFPKAILKMIEASDGMVPKKRAIIVGNSEIFGITMTKALDRIDIETEYITEESIRENLDKLKQADVVITAVGEPKIIDVEMIKAGVLLIDGGISREGDDVVGDVDAESMSGKVGTLTPVPGGVGPVTIACLLENVYIAMEQQEKKN